MSTAQSIDPSVTQATLAENFLKYFEVGLATTSSQIDSALRIRYDVYCEEFGYEPAENFPDKKEYDEYDDHSIHCLITHKSSGMPAGCVRLITTSDEEHRDLLPFEKVCRNILNEELVSELGLERETMCEVSRLTVHSAFRRRAGEGFTRYGKVSAADCRCQEQQAFELIAVANFLATMAVTVLTGRINVFALMGSYLPRLLSRSGIVYKKVGEDIVYHGRRSPYFGRTQPTLDNMRPGLKDLYNAIYDKINQSFVESR